MIEARLPGHLHDCAHCSHLTPADWVLVEEVSRRGDWVRIVNPHTRREQEVHVSTVREVGVLFGERTA